MAGRIVLASASPRRLQLLHQLDLECVVRPVCIDETPLQAEKPQDFVSRMAREKAISCRAGLAEELASLPVLGSDTIVVIDNIILGKPRDKQHAREMLTRLSASTHHVHTAVAISYSGKLYEIVNHSEVSFAHIHSEQIDRYIETGEPMDKAGAYAIQGRAAAFVSRLHGSFSGVMGLPLYETARLLATCDIEI